MSNSPFAHPGAQLCWLTAGRFEKELAELDRPTIVMSAALLISSR